MGGRLRECAEWPEAAARRGGKSVLILFSPENRDATVLALVESQGGTASAANEGARTRPSGRLDVAEVYAMVDALGDVAQAIKLCGRTA